MRATVAGSAVVVGACAMLACSLAMRGPVLIKQKAKPAPPRQVRIDFDKAVSVSLPKVKGDLQCASFRTVDGRSGWVLQIPGGRPLATPAYAAGRIFVGGGYGSHEFYAFNAKTGAVAWKIHTSDDGPSAAVVEDGCVAFNTESCTIIVSDARTGRVLWQEWLGDPLMSQPAIWKGRLYIAHPAGQRGGQSDKGGASNEQVPRGWDHRMLCAGLHTGKHYWSRPIPADVISAPVVEGGRLFFTCFEGTSFCLDATTGAEVWRKKGAATSAPVIVDGELYATRKVMQHGVEYEGIQRMAATKGQDRGLVVASGKASYLAPNRGGGVAMSSGTLSTLDSSVGFGGSGPAAAKLSGANAHVGVGTVAGAWAYQGARASYGGGQVMNAQGSYVNAVRARDGRMAWRAEAVGKSIDKNAQVFAPPALGARNLYLCSGQGHMASVRQKDGSVAFLYSFRQPMVFQPALAEGRVFAGTVNGMLICLDTKDRDADGWTAWGGNAQHNRKR